MRNALLPIPHNDFQTYHSTSDEGDVDMDTQTSFSPAQSSDASVQETTQAVMPEKTMEQFIENERIRLTNAREAALAKKAEIEASLISIDGELAAISAYEAAKKGKRPGRRGSGTRTRRGPARQKIVDVITVSTDGLTRGEVIEALGVKNDRAGEQSVSNSLAALKRSSKLQQNDDGKYLVV